MRAYSLSHLSDPELIRGLISAVAHERTATAAVLAHIKRIQAARVARQFPAIFEALADGRLHLGAVGLLAPHLTPENAADLLAAAAHKTKAGIEAMLAERFPRTEALGLVTALPPSPTQLAPGQVGPEAEVVPERVELSAPGRIDRPTCHSKLAPVAAERFDLQLTIGRGTRDKLQRAQELLGHALPSDDLAQVLDRALDALIEQLERRKFAATSRPGRARSSTNQRHIAAAVRRAVWARDGGQCTFVSESGHRCQARKLIEFDHVEPVARGGTATVAGLRLRCRAHNQYGAECAFGAGFMRVKREAAQRAAEARRPEAAARNR